MLQIFPQRDENMSKKDFSKAGRQQAEEKTLQQKGSRKIF
jgi:hypothetical protein